MKRLFFVKVFLGKSECFAFFVFFIRFFYFLGVGGIF